MTHEPSAKEEPWGETLGTKHLKLIYALTNKYDSPLRHLGSSHRGHTWFYPNVDLVGSIVSCIFQTTAPCAPKIKAKLKNIYRDHCICCMCIVILIFWISPWEIKPETPCPPGNFRSFPHLWRLSKPKQADLVSFLSKL